MDNSFCSLPTFATLQLAVAVNPLLPLLSLSQLATIKRICAVGSLDWFGGTGHVTDSVRVYGPWYESQDQIQLRQ